MGQDFGSSLASFGSVSPEIAVTWKLDSSWRICFPGCSITLAGNSVLAVAWVLSASTLHRAAWTASEPMPGFPQSKCTREPRRKLQCPSWPSFVNHTQFSSIHPIICTSLLPRRGYEYQEARIFEGWVGILENGYHRFKLPQFSLSLPLSFTVGLFESGSNSGLHHCIFLIWLVSLNL